jgi:HIV Tat-specific factor 1
MEAEAEYWTFPTNPEEFDQDDRISYSKLDNKYIAVQEDGTEYEFDAGLKRWIPIIDEALIEEQQKGYFMPSADADNDHEGPAQGRKRKVITTDREVSCAHMHICSVGRPARRHALLLLP